MFVEERGFPARGWVISGIDLGDGKTAQVDFDYNTKSMAHLNGEPQEPRRATRAHIVVSRGETLLGEVEGLAVCNPIDQFDYLRGRKIAIRRAFDSPGAKEILPADARKRIVEALIVPAVVKRKASRR